MTSRMQSAPGNCEPTMSLWCHSGPLSKHACTFLAATPQLVSHLYQSQTGQGVDRLTGFLLQPVANAFWQGERQAGSNSSLAAAQPSACYLLKIGAAFAS